MRIENFIVFKRDFAVHNEIFTSFLSIIDQISTSPNIWLICKNKKRNILCLYSIRRFTFYLLFYLLISMYRLLMHVFYAQ